MLTLYATTDITQLCGSFSQIFPVGQLCLQTLIFIGFYGLRGYDLIESITNPSQRFHRSITDAPPVGSASCGSAGRYLCASSKTPKNDPKFKRDETLAGEAPLSSPEKTK